MKLDPEFISKDHTLFTVGNDVVDTADLQVLSYAAIRGGEVPKLVSGKKPIVLQCAWTAVESEPEVYDESYLADLRTYLKELEDTGCYAVIEPMVDNALSGDEERFVAAMKHTARRIKDCKSVVGFAIPQAVQNVSMYLDELSQKHEQYVFFGHKELTKLSEFDGIVWY
ncbi:MAG: hypothetical protein K6E51_08300 [Treponema sp.]|nr:hypothetical protein [Treponema sp.]